MTEYAFGLVAGVTLITAFVGGFLTAVHIRFWREKITALREDQEERNDRAIGREQDIDRMLAESEMEEEASGDFSPLGDVPPSPGDIKRNRFRDRFKRRVAS